MDTKRLFHKLKPFLAAVFLHLGLAGMDILRKAALNKGMSNYVLVVYRHAITTIVIAPFAFFLDKNPRPKMTLPIFIRLMVLSLLGPVIDQNLYYLGMKHTTATFTAAMCNILPAITFVMAWIMRLEKVKIESIWSQAKVFGTLVTVAGAIIITLFKGPVFELFWTTTNNIQNGSAAGGINPQNSIMGSLLVTLGCFSRACFKIFQENMREKYPAELAITAWINCLGTAMDAVLALLKEGGNTTVWFIALDTRVLTAVFIGIVCAGVSYYAEDVVKQDRQPVFVDAFSPLSTVIVAILSTIILAEQLFLGRLIGAVVIVAGLYLVVWGKSKDHPGANGEENSSHEMITISACENNETPETNEN